MYEVHALIYHEGRPSKPVARTVELWRRGLAGSGLRDQDDPEYANDERPDLHEYFVARNCLGHGCIGIVERRIVAQPALNAEM